MKQAIILIFAIAVAFTAMAEPAQIALVVGNAAYSEGIPALGNPANDAADIAAALSGAGWRVTKLVDANRRDFNRSISTFRDALKGNPGSTALFFYAGHGVQIDGKNYMLPIGEVFNEKDDVTLSAVCIDRIVDVFSEGRTKDSLIILDACREDPFAKMKTRAIGATRGLAVIPAPDTEGGSATILATKAGDVAQDGKNARNSPFTEAFLRNFNSGLPLDQFFVKVRTDVVAKTSGQQTPQITTSGILSGFYLGSKKGGQGGGLQVTATARLPETGSLKISVREKGELYLDGALKTSLAAGASLSLDALGSGKHILEMRYADSSEKQEVTVQPNAAQAVSFSYVVKAKVGSLLLKNLPADCTVKLDGADMPWVWLQSGAGLKTGTLASVAAGNHLVSAGSSFGQAAVVNPTVVTENGNTIVEFPTGNFAIAGVPARARVLVGGKTLAFASGAEGLVSPPLLAGDYSVSVAGDYLEPLTMPIKVSVGSSQVYRMKVSEFGIVRPLVAAGTDVSKVRMELRRSDDSVIGSYKDKDQIKLAEGEYRLLASFSNDIEPGKVIAFRVQPGSTQELRIESLQYSVAYRIKAKVDEREKAGTVFAREKASLTEELARSKASRGSMSGIGWTMLGIGVAALGGGAASYYLGSQATAEYNAAGTSSKAAELRSSVQLFSTLFTVSIGAGGGLTGLSSIFLFMGPDPKKVEGRMQTLEMKHASSVSAIDAEIARLNVERANSERSK